MADDPEKTLHELRQRIAAEGLPKLSPEALRAFKRSGEQAQRWPMLQKVSDGALGLSEEARRLFHERSDPEWPWQRWRS
jgi:hypothetical protein